MTPSEGYGERLAEHVLAEQAHAIVTRALRTADMAVTETRCDAPAQEMSGSFQREDSFLVTLTLRDFPHREYWEEGRVVSVSDIRVGQSCIHDLKRDPVARLDQPYNVLFWYLPRSAFNAIADDAEAPRIGDLDHRTEPIDDPTIAHLGQAVLPALRSSDQANQLFVGHALLALGTHVAQTYGFMRPPIQPLRGGLAAWQLRRAKELLGANLHGRVPLSDVAHECRLSVSHFSRAFRHTVGAAPHEWLLNQRIAVAKEKLRNGQLPLVEVASLCGFADQSHFTRVFTHKVGISPGAWRRMLDL
jgi:AraC family transcriptional regulator